ncbi:MAG: polynucleotide kinase-phosphatase [Synergistaceae bacterium]|jgi:protein phosphatase|nr:polynucleotide kinase-phosphatase [Synergistaceae bacterium]
MQAEQLKIPALCVVALIGASGSGKSTFARRVFKPTEVLSSDFFRGLVSDDENDQSCTKDAFDALYYVANKRLDAGKLVVIDATNVQKKAREKLLQTAGEQNCHAVAIVLDLPEELCQTRNKLRPDRNYPAHVVRSHVRELKRSLKHLRHEGFRYVYVLNSQEDADSAELVRTPLWSDKRDEAGPFDIIGDVHGCYDELCELLGRMGYSVDRDGCAAVPPGKRKAVFLGDLCDRGPENVKTLRLAMNMVEAKTALCVPGNHEVKLLRKLKGAEVSPTHGFDVNVRQMESEPPEFADRVKIFLDGLVSHYILDGGNLVVAHAGLKEKLHGRASGKVRSFCLYGETTGETDEFGLPVRFNWAEEYRGRPKVVYGHTPSMKVQTANNTHCIDTGCVFGGKLTALRYPENELVQVSAGREYYAPSKPLQGETDDRGDMLDINDVLGKLYISTRFHRGISIQEENSAAALEIMSRFSADPRWLIYLPPTMSPCEASGMEDYLEHPLEAMNYYRKRGAGAVVCEEKHMGSRAVIVLCRDDGAAKSRFGVEDGSIGLIYTRTGRHFFDAANSGKEAEILRRLCAVLEATGFWKEFGTDWVCLDAELMPWSAKAGHLLAEQYAPVGRAGLGGLGRAVSVLGQAAGIRGQEWAAGENASGQNVDLAEILGIYEQRRESVGLYVDAYRRYCWPVESVDDYRIAPFHVLATENRVWSECGHLTHLEAIERYMTGIDPIFMATEHISADLSSDAGAKEAVDWWSALTESGGEGMVVKPLDFIHRFDGGLIQPAVKCRGREYLRIIYGPEYTRPDHLKRLKKRSLAKKSRLALSEFSLGMESLERFVKRDPLYRVHECVFAVLAMESEPVDPRL